MYVSVAGFGTVPFDTKELGGVTYRVANDQLRSIFSGSLVGWKVRSSALSDLGHEEDPLKDIERERTETALMTPYNESTGPRDSGDGFRWVEYRRMLGRGVIIIPPAGWQVGDDVLRQRDGEITAIATEDFGEVKKHASNGQRGFVLVEPAQGWKNADAPVQPLPGIDDASTKTLLLAAGIIVGVVAVGYWAWGRS